MAWGEITDEGIEEARALIGVPLRRNEWRWFECASKDAIRHFVMGTGDDNPLWLDPEYAKSTVHGTLLAPPCFLYSIDATTVAPKLPGVQWIYAANEFLWNDHIRLDDCFKVKSYLTDVEKKSTEFSPVWVMQTGVVEYLRDDFLLATATNKIARTLRGKKLAEAGGGKAKYETRETHSYTQAELDQIEREALSEPRRGSDTLYWEDVNVGDEVPAVVKGPLTGTDIVGWYSCVHGTQPYGGTHELVYKYRNRHADFHMNPTTGARDSAGRGHLEVSTGVDVGMGGAYDIGPQRISWAGHMMTNWIGDDGFLRRLNVEVRRPNLLGDTTWWKGIVTGKRRVGKYAVVDVDIFTVNQREEKTTWGDAEVFLASRETGPVVLPVSLES